MATAKVLSMALGASVPDVLRVWRGWVYLPQCYDASLLLLSLVAVQLALFLPP